MPIKAKPFGCNEKFDWGADVHSVSYDGRLVIRVLRNRNKDDGIEVAFSQVDGFRFLDEVQLAEYWIDEDFPSGYPVLEVLEGGWAQEEEKHLGYRQHQREWIIVTAEACVSVFSKTNRRLSMQYGLSRHNSSLNRDPHQRASRFTAGAAGPLARR